VKLLKLLIILTLLTNFLHADTIAQQWEATPEYEQYLNAMNQGDLKTAIQIKKVTVNEITKITLKDCISDFKPKYREKYLKKFQEFPLGLIDLTKSVHKAGSKLLKDKSIKSRNDFVKSLYDFMKQYHIQKGKAQKYALRIVKKSPDVKDSSFMDILIKMGKDSDIEANKSSEQKQKEHDDYMKAKQRSIDNENRKQAKWQKIIDDLNGL